MKVFRKKKTIILTKKNGSLQVLVIGNLSIKLKDRIQHPKHWLKNVGERKASGQIDHLKAAEKLSKEFGVSAKAQIEPQQMTKNKLNETQFCQYV